MLFTLVEQAENDAIMSLGRGEHSYFVAEPEKLDCSFDVAHKLVKHLIIVFELLRLWDLSVKLCKSGCKTILGELPALVFVWRLSDHAEQVLPLLLRIFHFDLYAAFTMDAAHDTLTLALANRLK